MNSVSVVCGGELSHAILGDSGSSHADNSLCRFRSRSSASSSSTSDTDNAGVSSLSSVCSGDRFNSDTMASGRFAGAMCIFLSTRGVKCSDVFLATETETARIRLQQPP